jgi:hypothetical protein
MEKHVDRMSDDKNSMELQTQKINCRQLMGTMERIVYDRQKHISQSLNLR